MGKRVNISQRYNSVVVVKVGAQLAGALRSDRLYQIDGAIDLGDGSINVPSGGLQISGLGFDVSSLTTTGTLFSYTDEYSGSLQIADLSLEAGNVFDLDNDGNSGAVECNGVNFVSCASIGGLANYRQGLWSNVGVVFCTDGVELIGAWSGFATLTSIVIGGFAGTLFKAGAGLTMGGSFRSDVNALGLGDGGAVCDFAPANISTDGGFAMEGVRCPAGSDAFPNMPSSDTRARFRNCSGVRNTYPGEAVEFTVSGTTSIGASDTLYEITASGVGIDAQWCSIESGRRIRYDSTQEIEAEISGSMSFSGNNNRKIGIQIRKWSASDAIYVNVGPEYAATLNGGQAGTRAENVGFSGSTSLNQNDRIEIWIKNVNNTDDITTDASGRFAIRER